MAIGTLSIDDLQALLASEDLYACLDVRERGEFGLGQIEGVTPLARGTIEYRLPTMVPSLDVPIAVLCSDGRRSLLAAATMAAMGYRDVRVVNGGFDAWKARGLPTIAGWGVRGKEYAERIAVDRGVPQTTAKELADLRRRGQKVTVVDVRTAEEFLRGHVPEAYHIPGGQLLLKVGALPRDPDHALVMSCAGRTRGILGAYVLRQAGFPNVSALLNGAMGWRLAGFDLESGPAHGELAGEASGGALPLSGRGPAVPGEIAEATRHLMSERAIQAMPVAEFDALRASGRPYYAVDVRLPDEYQQGHVPGSISVPAGQFALQHENFMAVRPATVVILSDDPIRQVWAAAQCKDLGFLNTSVLDGGIRAWAALPGHDLETGGPSFEVFGLQEARQEVSGVSVQEARELQSASAGAVLLDVRGSGEFGLGHIPGARWLARGRLELDVENVLPNRSAEVVTVCDTGVRSTLAAATLRRLGFAKVRVLDGGVPAWRAAGLPVVDTLDGADVSKEEAQNDAGSTQWTGALARSRADMESYLAAEEALARRDVPHGRKP